MLIVKRTSGNTGDAVLPEVLLNYYRIIVWYISKPIVVRYRLNNNHFQRHFENIVDLHGCIQKEGNNHGPRRREILKSTRKAIGLKYSLMQR